MKDLIATILELSIEINAQKYFTCDVICEKKYHVKYANQRVQLVFRHRFSEKTITSQHSRDNEKYDH